MRRPSDDKLKYQVFVHRLDPSTANILFSGRSYVEDRDGFTYRVSFNEKDEEAWATYDPSMNRTIDYMEVGDRFWDYDLELTLSLVGLDGDNYLVRYDLTGIEESWHSNVVTGGLVTTDDELSERTIINVNVDLEPELDHPEWNRPRLGCFSIYNRIDEETWGKIKKANASWHVSQDWLDDNDDFESAPGWKYNYSALVILVKSGYAIRVRNLTLSSEAELRHVFSAAGNKAWRDGRKTTKES